VKAVADEVKDIASGTRTAVDEAKTIAEEVQLAVLDGICLML
jgi:methyl-accepting chemotaxis protein